jgi:uncharacterized protein YjbJ (UPF0337 family)
VLLDWWEPQVGNVSDLTLINRALREIIMAGETIKGKGKQVEGSMRESIGKHSGNTSEQVKGGLKKAEGKIEEGIGKLKRKI